jgi:hypothetical protein
VLKLPNLDRGDCASEDPAARSRMRQEIGRIDTELDGLRRQRIELDQRASETREQPRGDQEGPAGRRPPGPAEQAARGVHPRRRQDRSHSWSSCRSKRLEKKIELEDQLQNIDLSVPDPPTATPAKTAGGK